MKRAFRLLALALMLFALACWLVGGANRGWTKTRVPVTRLDEVTGLDGITFEKKFVPGVDFVFVAALGAGLLAGLSCLFRKPSTSKS
jgi:hypothetical protein